jgi:hypothetical protein
MDTYRAGGGKEEAGIWPTLWIFGKESKFKKNEIYTKY